MLVRYVISNFCHYDEQLSRENELSTMHSQDTKAIFFFLVLIFKLMNMLEEEGFLKSDNMACNLCHWMLL